MSVSESEAKQEVEEQQEAAQEEAADAAAPTAEENQPAEETSDQQNNNEDESKPAEETAPEASETQPNEEENAENANNDEKSEEQVAAEEQKDTSEMEKSEEGPKQENVDDRPSAPNYPYNDRSPLASASSSKLPKHDEEMPARQFCDFLDASPSPWHAINELTKVLKARGYEELKEASSESWCLRKTGKYYMTRNHTSLFAFSVGGRFKPGKDGRFAMIGAHSDAPCIRIKPVSKIDNKQGFVQVGVECYGGGQWPTWLDRDLRVAGRVIHKRANGSLASKLVHINKPFMRIPTLAVHLNREQTTKLELNTEDHTMPIMSMAKDIIESHTKNQLNSIHKRHHSVLLEAIAKATTLEADNIVDFELCLADYQPAEIGGALDEFIYGPRLDNLLSTWTAVQSLMNADDSLGEDAVCRVAAIYDHEEVGSQSCPGAGSAVQRMILKRICHGVDPSIDACAFERCMPRSLCISADMAHACHPNYAHKHEQRMQLTLTDGPAIKYNTNQRYATNAETASIIRDIAAAAGVPLQEICNRNDVPCGSTIGPITSANLGMPTIDMGAPQFSMHSIREMCHVCCVEQNMNLFQAFYSNFQSYVMSSDERFKHED